MHATVYEDSEGMANGIPVDRSYYMICFESDNHNIELHSIPIIGIPLITGLESGRITNHSIEYDPQLKIYYCDLIGNGPGKKM